MDPCAILLSEIGKHYHSFPKGTFCAQFIPPTIPHSVLQHLAAHPQTWSWMTRAGPSTGKSFQVPTVPIVCRKDSPKAIQWLVSAFHSFKSQLIAQALSPETGRVLRAYVQLYQNNMLLHLHAQQAQVGPPPSASAFITRAQPGHTPPPPTVVIVEIAVLWSEFKAFCSKHEASQNPPLTPPAHSLGLVPSDPSLLSSSHLLNALQRRVFLILATCGCSRYWMIPSVLTLSTLLWFPYPLHPCLRTLPRQFWSLSLMALGGHWVSTLMATSTCLGVSPMLL